MNISEHTNIEVVKACLDNEPMAFISLPDKYKNEPEVLRMVIKSCPQLIYHSKAVLNYDEYEQIIKKHGELIAYVPAHLQDSNMVELALNSKGFKAYARLANKNIELTKNRIAELYIKTDMVYRAFIHYWLKGDQQALSTATDETRNKIAHICNLITEKNSALATLINLDLSMTETQRIVKRTLIDTTKEEEIQVGLPHL